MYEKGVALPVHIDTPDQNNCMLLQLFKKNPRHGMSNSDDFTLWRQSEWFFMDCDNI